MKKAFKFSAIISMLAILVCFVALMAPQVYAAEAGTLVSNPIELQSGVYYNKYWTNTNYSLNCYNKITVPSKGYITVTIEKPYDNEGEIGSFDLDLYNENGDVIWGALTVFQVDSFSDSYIYQIGLDAGVYYLNLIPRFYVYSDSAPILSRYKYEFTADSYWEAEPNDNKSAATVMEINKMYTGFYGEEPHSIAKDYYSFDLVQGINIQ